MESIGKISKFSFLTTLNFLTMDFIINNFLSKYDNLSTELNDTQGIGILFKTGLFPFIYRIKLLSDRLGEEENDNEFEEAKQDVQRLLGYMGTIILALTIAKHLNFNLAVSFLTANLVIFSGENCCNVLTTPRRRY